PLHEKKRGEILSLNESFAKDALRVLALAWRSSKEPLDFHKLHSVEKELTFIALAGMIDPPRQEVFEAVAKAENAGITPIMITGDHKLTAVAIAKELGIFKEGEDSAYNGEELDRLPDGEFDKLLPTIKVYARVNPEHKLRVVKAWRKRGDIIAMTGDGVNDAPALKEADIGVAMGITGTDVTTEAGDMVLTDDNFASIVSAVEEGRGIFDNIRKVVHYLLSCNIGEILVLLIASLIGMPLPLLPIHILWMNLVTDGLPALGLAMEEVDKGVMDRKPRAKDEGIVTGSLIRVMALQGLFMAVCTLTVYMIELRLLGASIEKARTMAFMVIVFCQMFHVFNCRSEWRSVFAMGVFSNRMLNIAVLIILATQVSIVYIPGLQVVFKITLLSVPDWSVVFGAAVLPLVLMEAVKAGKRGWAPRPTPLGAGTPAKHCNGKQ
ncbi:MAG: cation-transporting P-type ATPase, partial [Deltaproteobacteria bacterium]|nr:cation-transporting P-type ATPase [Deltaproteobacteria bacterium]